MRKESIRRQLGCENNSPTFTHPYRPLTQDVVFLARGMLGVKKTQNRGGTRVPSFPPEAPLLPSLPPRKKFRQCVRHSVRRTPPLSLRRVRRTAAVAAVERRLGMGGARSSTSNHGIRVRVPAFRRPPLRPAPRLAMRRACGRRGGGKGGGGGATN